MFFSGYQLWEPKIEKLSLMGCLFLTGGKMTFFEFWPKKWPLLKILAPNPKIGLDVLFVTASSNQS